MSNVDMSVWRGRQDSEELTPALRWHQRIKPLEEGAEPGGKVILGFACDEGVIRNHGRPGAKEGPIAIRAALGNLACYNKAKLWDAGNVLCQKDKLETAQNTLARTIAQLLSESREVTVLGGGHEIALASFHGIIKYLKRVHDHPQKLGIVNFDAHFDLRNPVTAGSSGTPFRQICEWSKSNDWDFHYLVLGLNPTSNTGALFDYAGDNGVEWLEDVDMHLAEEKLTSFVAKLDYLYITVCMDVFPSTLAPGVSAPAAVGVSPASVIACLRALKRLCEDAGTQIILRDVAEMNPRFDRDGQTARLAARLVWEMNAH